VGAPGRVDGKIVIVTGAAGGQGAAEVAWLVREGAHVVATDLAEDAPVPKGRGTAVYRRLDVSSAEGWADVVGATAGEHGVVDGLVNNAGVAHRARLDDVTVEDWNRVFAVNVTGAMLGIQTVSRVMTRGGSIVNVGSVAALTAHYTVAYTASKWALRGLSRVASMELGPRGIRVNAIHPGYIETPMTASAPAAFLEASLAVAPLGRAGTPDDVAPLVGFLLSDESSYLSGAEIPIDGGQSGHAGAKALSDALRGRADTETGGAVLTNGAATTSQEGREAPVTTAKEATQ
jgi:3alpha(or 20beta)-hydroxysteroid dehydrogenase